MKIILLENVRKVGSIGEIIDVKRGFARNFLISKKKALFASKANIKEVEIIPGKGSGQLKKKVLRFLNQPDIKKLYHRINKDSKNFGRIFVYFK